MTQEALTGRTARLARFIMSLDWPRNSALFHVLRTEGWLAALARLTPAELAGYQHTLMAHFTAQS